MHPVRFRQLDPVRPRFFQQAKRSIHIRAHEIIRPMNRAVRRGSPAAKWTIARGRFR